MNIAVCVKQVPSSNERFIDPVTGGVIRDGVASVINPYDAHAVEAALRVRSRAGGIIRAFSMGVPSAAQTLRRALAVGVDEAYLLSDPAFAGADTLATAYTLSQAIKRAGGADLIICGRMATDGDTAQVGPMLAETLGIPHATDVSGIDDIDIIDNNYLDITRMTDDGYVRVRLPLPALITVNKEINIPRLPSIIGVLSSRQARITHWRADDIGADTDRTGSRGSATRVVSVSHPEPKARCVMLDSPQTLTDLLRGKGLV